MGEPTHPSDPGQLGGKDSRRQGRVPCLPDELLARLKQCEAMEKVSRTWAERSLEEVLGHLMRPGAARRVAESEASLWAWARPGGEGEAALIPLEEDDRGKLEAAFELGRRKDLASVKRYPVLSSASSVAAYMRPRVADLGVEAFFAVLVDSRHSVQTAVLVSRGTLNSSLVHPREVFRPAVRARAAAVIVVHNHPSGDPSPSREDDAVTHRLADAGRLLGIPLLDHIVLGGRDYVSYREAGHQALDPS